MLDYLSPTDLFVVGLALDLTGAYLLARGLLLSPGEIAGLGTWGALDVGMQVDRIEDRIDSEAGLGALLAGFAVQGVGYVLTLGGVDATTGTCRVVAGLALGALVAVGWLVVWHRTRDARVRSLLVRVALSREGSGDPGDEHRTGWTYQKARLLVRYGRGAGYDPHPEEEEHWELYARRVFGVELRPEDINWSREPK